MIAAEMIVEDTIVAEMIIVMGVPVIEVAVTMTEIVGIAESMIVADLVLQDVMVGTLSEVIIGHPKSHHKKNVLKATYTNFQQVDPIPEDVVEAHVVTFEATLAVAEVGKET
jgi:hypothetical protein